MQLHVDPDSVDFKDATARGYFQEFVQLVQGPWINASANDDLWKVTVPQIARTNDVLRSAATAIGALSTWHRRSLRRSLHAVPVPEVPTREEDTHYFHAIGYYCHSIKLQSQRALPQDAVFLSLLLIFFESLRGNRQAALDHVNHGLTLLLALLTDENTESLVAKIAPNPKPLLGAVADIFTLLAGQVRTVLRGRLGQGPSLPHLTRELRSRKHTMESFMILLSELPRPVVGRDGIPEVFSSIDEFEEYWLIGRRRQTKALSIMAEAIYSSAIIGSNQEDSMDRLVLELLGNPRIKEFCEESRKEMQALDSAFLPLFNKVIMAVPQSPDYLRVIQLRLQYLASYVIEDPTQSLDVEALQSRTHLFREYMSLAEIALRTASRDNENPAYQFSLQCGVAWYLLVAALFCRDPLTRDQAVWMLRDYPGQDGLWSTRSLYLLALRNRHIERITAVEGTPAEQWRRLWRREFVFEDSGNRIILRYLDKDVTTGKWTLIEEVADVQLDPDGEVHWARQPLTGSGGLLIADLYSERGMNDD